MSALTHAIVGASVAASQENIPLGFAFAVISHFVADIIPHNDYIYCLFKFNKNKSSAESFISIVLFIIALITVLTLFILTRNPRIIIGALGGILPDALTVILDKFNITNSAFNKFHNFVQKYASLAEISYSKFNRSKIIDPINESEYYSNYLKIAGTTVGRVTWLVEISVEITVLLGSLYFLVTH